MQRKSLKKLRATSWAKQFRKECIACYPEAIFLASSPDLIVELDHNNETGLNDWVWSISVVSPESHYAFWLDSKKTKKEALALCKEMGWKVQKKT